MSDDRIIKTIHDYQTRIKLFSGLHRLMAVVACICIPLGVVFLWIMLPADSETTLNIPLIIVCLVLFFFGLWLADRTADKLKTKLKQFAGEHVVREILAERIDVREYKPEGSLDKDFLHETGVLPGFDNVCGSDYIRGIYKGNEIMYCDLKLEQEQETTDSDGNRSYKTVTVFRGQVISLVLGKPLGDKRVRILERVNKRKTSEFMQNALGAVAGMLGIKVKEQSVSLENEAFNNQFEVKTNDEELAFYILTPQFMESIVRADMLAAGRTNICFGGSRANISMNNGRDAFELGRKCLTESN